jgi:hypothetical protein
MPLIDEFNPDPVDSEIAMQYGTGGGFAQDVIMPTRTVLRDRYKGRRWNMRDYVEAGQTDSKRAPGAAAQFGKEPGVTYFTGAVTERTQRRKIVAENVNNASDPAAVVNAKIRALVNALRGEIEMEVADEVMDETAHETLECSVAWGGTNSDFLGDIDAGKEAFLLQNGMLPTHLLLPPAVMLKAFLDPELVEIRKYLGDEGLLKGTLPPLRDLEFVVPGAIRDASNPGATAVIQRIWNQDAAALLYVDPSAATDDEAMTSILRVASATSAGQDWVAKRYDHWDESTNTEIVQVATFDDWQVTSDAILLLTNPLSAT